MYAKARSIEDARKVFSQLRKKDVVSWNSMLTGYAQHGLGKEVIQHFEEMIKHGVKPNEITFLCILNACSHGGLLKEGQYYLDLMKEYKAEPKIEHYVVVVDLLGRAGLLEQAQKLIDEPPLKPTTAVWGALLGSCRMHRNAELEKFVTAHVFELDPHDAGPHLVLHNIYAIARQWDDAVKVRKMMRESGLKKEPACSWLEIENFVHLLVANESSHTKIKAIEEMWEKINGLINVAGYVLDTSCVLMHVDEQDKETKLQYNSEKLALAFALLKLPYGVTIRIMKNIIICRDCHSIIKLISKLMNREIIMSDAHQFHHFSASSCSCDDYL